jgi:hypothetical protein
VRDRLVDLRLASATGVDREAHRAVLRDALGAELVTSCKSFSSAQTQCLLDAPDLTAADTCTKTASR